MPKKIKLNLNELNVKSFATSNYLLGGIDIKSKGDVTECEDGGDNTGATCNVDTNTYAGIICENTNP